MANGRSEVKKTSEESAKHEVGEYVQVTFSCSESIGVRMEVEFVMWHRGIRQMTYGEEIVFRVAYWITWVSFFAGLTVDLFVSVFIPAHESQATWTDDEVPASGNGAITGV